MTGQTSGLAIVISHPTQYYSPWFVDLARRLNGDLKVFYLWDFGVQKTRDRRFGEEFSWDIDLLSGYASEFVPNTSRDPGTHHFGGLKNPSLIAEIEKFGPTFVLLFGYKYHAHQQLIRAARHEGWRLGFRGDSHLLGHRAPSLLKRMLLGWNFRKFDAFLYVGQANRRYFKTFGVPDSKLFFAPHSVDASRFKPCGDPERNRLRQEVLGLAEDDLVVLYSGKFHPEKAPMDLLNAAAKLDDSQVHFVFAGAGEQEDKLKERTAEMNLENVHFLPFANQSEMPRRYALADLFALPSIGLYETWGLAVNEAMHSGVPCIVSDRVGCAEDLVSDGETGWTFPAGDVDALQDRLSTAVSVLTYPSQKTRLKTAVAERIKRYTYEQTTAGLVAAMGTPQEGAS